MKNLVLFFILICFTNSFPQWVQSNSGMGNQSVGALISDGDSLYAGCTFGIFKSTDEGDNWFAINNGLPSVVNLYAMARSGNFLIAGGDSPGIWLSSDNGADWFQTTNGVDSEEYVQSFFVDGNNVYAAIGYPPAVGISSDNGNNWTKSSNGLSSNGLITGVTKLGTTLFATHSALGVYLSTDNGSNWTLIPGAIGAQDKNAIVNIGTNLCVAATNGVWTSTDAGGTWTHNLTTGIISGIGQEGIHLYAVGELPPYSSANNGINWTPVDDNGLAGTIFNTMQFTTHYAFINTFGAGVLRR